MTDGNERERVIYHLTEALACDESGEKDFHVRHALHLLGVVDDPT